MVYILIDGSVSNETIIQGDYTNPAKIFDYKDEVLDYLNRMYNKCIEEGLDIGGVHDFLEDFALYHSEDTEDIELIDVEQVFKLNLQISERVAKSLNTTVNKVKR